MRQDENLPHLHQSLKERHITLMSLGSTIGVGLFLGSASAIKLAGPSILFAYTIAGFAIFFIMRALGEMTIHRPISGSFGQYAYDYLGPLVGYLTGWNYWFLWVITCMAEITAIGVYMQYWFPNTPRWLWALLALLLMSICNFMAVKLYGELEFWFSLIKIVTIIFMIVVGTGMILFGIGNQGIPTGIHNLWDHGGIFPNGIKGFLLSLQIVLYGYLGIEMIGLTVGEAQNPKKSISKAINNVFWRILIFYVGALFVIMSIYPWNSIGDQGSPFVLTFEQIGIAKAAAIINFVVVTAALSSCNGGLFSTGRMLFTLARQGKAPRAFGELGKNGVPIKSTLVTSAVLLIGVVLNYLVPGKVFTWLTSIATFAAIWTWIIIIISQLQFRKKLSNTEKKKLSYKIPFFPYSSYMTLMFLLVILVTMLYSDDNRIALIVGPIWILMLTGIYYKKFKKDSTLSHRNQRTS
ncbi:amino acid permease [Bacillus cereus]